MLVGTICEHSRTSCSVHEQKIGTFLVAFEILSDCRLALLIRASVARKVPDRYPQACVCTWLRRRVLQREARFARRHVRFALCSVHSANLQPESPIFVTPQPVSTQRVGERHVVRSAVVQAETEPDSQSLACMRRYKNIYMCCAHRLVCDTPL